MEPQPQPLVHISPNYLLRLQFTKDKIYIKLHIFSGDSILFYETSLGKKFCETGRSLSSAYECFKNKQLYEVAHEKERIMLKLPLQNDEIQLYSLILKKVEGADQGYISTLKGITQKLQMHKKYDRQEIEHHKKELLKKFKKSRYQLDSYRYNKKKLNSLAQKYNELVEEIRTMRKNLFADYDVDQEQLNPMNIDDSEYHYNVVVNEKKKAKNKKQFNPSQLEMPLDTSSRYLKKFGIGKNIIKYNSDEHQFTQILMDKTIPFSQRYEFHIYVSNSKNGKIMVGIVNQGRIDKRRSYDSGRAVCYYGYNGWVCDNESHTFKTQGTGFKTGDTITITTELDKGLVEWRVNGNTQGRAICEILRNRFLVFVPYLQMYEKGDTCKWMGDWVNDRIHRLSVI